ncbi:helix-turn-helix domain-containing protein [Streptomyces sp. NPDC050617]|uniref:IclR family transcriptional regulator n=1 Tax=Streptomyces sp. NPDC050617 TaxID=3154628 RepID=UPI00341E3BE1
MATANIGASSQPTLIGSVQRALRLLEAVGAHRDGAPAKQLAREAGLPLPTAYHLLRTLTHEGYLRRENGVFLYGDAAMSLGGVDGREERRAGITGTLAGIGEELGVPLYFAAYREGEVDVLAVADGPEFPAVQEWADFRETAHAHALGQCLLAQLGDEERDDYLARHPVRPLTPYSARDRADLLRRLENRHRLQPVFEQQEYALGTVCAAFPIVAGTAVATMAVSLPSNRVEQLRPVVESLRSRVGELVSSLSFSISI